MIRCALERLVCIVIKQLPDVPHTPHTTAVYVDSFRLLPYLARKYPPFRLCPTLLALGPVLHTGSPMPLRKIRTLHEEKA